MSRALQGGKESDVHDQGDLAVLGAGVSLLMGGRGDMIKDSMSNIFGNKPDGEARANTAKSRAPAAYEEEYNEEDFDELSDGAYQEDYDEDPNLIDEMNDYSDEGESEAEEEDDYAFGDYGPLVPRQVAPAQPLVPRRLPFSSTSQSHASLPSSRSFSRVLLVVAWA